MGRGGFWFRAGAYAVDLAAGLLLWSGAFVLLAVAGGEEDALPLIVLVGSFVIAVVVYGVIYGTRRTLGQLLFGLRTVRTIDGRRVGAWRGIWRMLGGALLVPGVPLLVIGLILSASSYTVIDRPVRFAVVRTR